ncbi:MAG: ABC transporter transmembrane domain-containing protein, partial [Myxococcota bacterium]
MSPEPQSVTLGRLFGLARPEAGLLVIATAALLISSALGLVYPIAVQWMIEAISGDEPPIDFDTAALMLVVLFAVQSVFSMVRAWLFTVAGERVVARLRTDLYSAIIGQDISFFDQSRTGELTNRLASDTTVLQNTVTVNISMGLRFTAQTIGAVVMLLVMSRELTLLAMAVVPVVAIGAALYGRWIQRLSAEVQDALAASTEVAEESISGLRTVRSFAREEREVARYGKAVDASYRLAARRALVTGMFNGTAGFAGYCAVALVVWYGGNLVTTGSMTVGELIAFLLYTLTVAFSLGALSGLYADFMRAVGASRRVFQLIDQEPALEGHGGRTLQSMGGRLELDHVHFRYPTRPDVPVLEGFQLVVEPGAVVALVGPSGSGKSTVAGLLVRFYDPDEGAIRVDGTDLRELDTTWWREQIGLVSQEPILFATSIAENIRYGRPDASDEDLREAARAANALGFVESFPEGFDTLVGERGVQLSGGQKQRIAIARAILKDPRFLVLDEATSALDSESEHLVQEALDRLMEGRTTVVIAHRLSTIRDADE